MFLALDLAIFERLVGAPLDGNGDPKRDARGIPVNRLLIAPPLHPKRHLPSYGVRIPDMKRGVDVTRGRSTDNPKPFHPHKDFTHKSSRRVPILPLNIEGRSWDVVWPCITFSWYDMVFGSAYVYADPFCAADRSAPTVQATDRNGSVVASGPKRLAFRNHPEPYDVTYSIRAYAKSLYEVSVMVEAIKRIFPGKGAIEVEQADGSRLALDMMFNRLENLDVGGQNVPMAAEHDDQRHFSRALIYTVEGYTDNTGEFDGDDGCSGNIGTGWTAETVRSRILEMADVQNSSAEGDWYHVFES